MATLVRPTRRGDAQTPLEPRVFAQYEAYGTPPPGRRPLLHTVRTAPLRRRSHGTGHLERPPAGGRDPRRRGAGGRGRPRPSSSATSARWRPSPTLARRRIGNCVPTPRWGTCS